MTSKRAETWTSDLTYHSLYQHEDDKKGLISPSGTNNHYVSREQPKTALRKQLSWLHPLVHLLPVIATAGVVQLSFRGIYWADDSRYYKDWQTILQFPAKLHEILIVGSLSAIILHICRRMLLSSTGIPLGLMVGAFQIGSAEYLFSRSYWKPLQHGLLDLQHKRFKAFLIASFLGASIVYSFLVGPASAAALLPNLNWWPMRNPFHHRLLQSYIGRESSELYPIELKETSIEEYCLNVTYYDSPDCPAGGYKTLFDWAWTREQEGSWYNVTDSQHYNPTMLSSFSGQAQREIVIGLVASKENSRTDTAVSSTQAAMSATLHASVLSLTDAFWHYVKTNTVGKINQVQQPKFVISQGGNVSIPLVQVQCQSYSLGPAINAGDDLKFETGAMVSDFSKSGSNAYVEAKWTVPMAAWNYPRPLPWNATNVTWVDTSQVKDAQGRKLPSSFGAVVTVPAVWSRDGSNGTTGYDQGSVITPCVIDARWATTDVSFDVTKPGVSTSLTEWLNTANLSAGNIDVQNALSKWNIGDPIAVSLDWVSAINNWGEDFGITEQILQQFVSPFSIDYPELLSFVPASSSQEHWTAVYANGIAIVLSTIVADWVSRTGLAGINFTTVLSEVKDGNVDTINLLNQKSTAGFVNQPISAFEKDQTMIVYSVERYGWGYGLNSKTIRFSIVTLLIHTVLVIAYFVYSFIFWCRTNGWTSESWGTIGELLALAVSSPPADEFKNTGSGIDESGTWMTSLRIREAGSDPDKIELVVGTRGGNIIPDTNKLQINKKYS
ncbi:hypothetical protein F4860DRAFT_465768 [Xylaria cubensis]|nr:hypothetical protein F4860DRAFT_465768 [Xylaria cubensis]